MGAGTSIFRRGGGARAKLRRRAGDWQVSLCAVH